MAIAAGRHASGDWEWAPSLLLCLSHLLPSLFALLSVALPCQPIHQTHTDTHGLKYTHVCPPTVSTLPLWALRHMLLTYCFARALISSPKSAHLCIFQTVKFLMVLFSVTPNIIVCSSAIFQYLFQFSFDRYSVSHNLSQISSKTCTRR